MNVDTGQVIELFQKIAQGGALGYSLISILWYLNQTFKKSGYIKGKFLPLAVGGQTLILIIMFNYLSVVFALTVIWLALWTAVMAYHGAVKDKAPNKFDDSGKE